MACFVLIEFRSLHVNVCLYISMVVYVLMVIALMDFIDISFCWNLIIGNGVCSTTLLRS